ncbi:MAG: ECF transporter S component [Erysipelotrichaceae bacterium]|nr:ECF transporter S component [Erysipelotrichaceae bacterium]
MKNLSIKTLAKIAILATAGVIIMLFDFPLTFIAPSFYKFDFSEVPVLIGAFAMGPLEAVAIEFVKVLLNLLFNGTITAGIGELANFLMGCALTVPAGIIYQKEKTRKNAIKGLLTGIIVSVIAGDLLNYFVLIPAYVNISHFPLEAIIAAGTKIFPVISNTLTLVLICVTLFNLFKGIAVSLVTLLIYKRISPLLH